MSHVRWDIESFTKLLWNKPWEKPFGADWVKVKIIISNIIMIIIIINLIMIRHMRMGVVSTWPK